MIPEHTVQARCFFTGCLFWRGRKTGVPGEKPQVRLRSTETQLTYARRGARHKCRIQRQLDFPHTRIAGPSANTDIRTKNSNSIDAMKQRLLQHSAIATKSGTVPLRPIKITSQPTMAENRGVKHQFFSSNADAKFQFLRKLQYYIHGRLTQNFGFVKRVDKDRIATVKDQESLCFERQSSSERVQGLQVQVSLG